MSDYKLSPDKPIDVAEILKDLENYRPRRRGWTWRKPVENLHMGPFVYHDCTEPLKSSVPLPPTHYFENIDPQPAVCERTGCQTAERQSAAGKAAVSGAGALFGMSVNDSETGSTASGKAGAGAGSADQVCWPSPR